MLRDLTIIAHLCPLKWASVTTSYQGCTWRPLQCWSSRRMHELGAASLLKRTNLCLSKGGCYQLTARGSAFDPHGPKHVHLMNPGSSLLQPSSSHCEQLSLEPSAPWGPQKGDPLSIQVGDRSICCMGNACFPTQMQSRKGIWKRTSSFSEGDRFSDASPGSWGSLIALRGSLNAPIPKTKQQENPWLQDLVLEVKRLDFFFSVLH